MAMTKQGGQNGTKWQARGHATCIRGVASRCSLQPPPEGRAFGARGSLFHRVCRPYFSEAIFFFWRFLEKRSFFVDYDKIRPFGSCWTFSNKFYLSGTSEKMPRSKPRPGANVDKYMLRTEELRKNSEHVGKFQVSNKKFRTTKGKRKQPWRSSSLCCSWFI